MARREEERPSGREAKNRAGRGSPKADPAGRRQGRETAGRTDGRRATGRKAPSPRELIPAIVTPIRLGDLVVDGAQLMIERYGRESWFTPAEWRLLCVFLRNPGTVLSREELAEHAWGVTDEERPGAVDVYISRVRRKLDPDGASSSRRRLPQLIQTVRHQGYQLVLDEADARAGEGSATG